MTQSGGTLVSCWQAPSPHPTLPIASLLSPAPSAPPPSRQAHRGAQSHTDRPASRRQRVNRICPIQGAYGTGRPASQHQWLRNPSSSKAQ